MSSAPSSADSAAFDAAIDQATLRILAAVIGLSAPTVLVDGRSGSGKTTLAARLAEHWGGPIHVLALDDVYPGWDGLDAGVDEVRDRVLVPRSRGGTASWRRWDWAAHERAETHGVPTHRPLVVEGSGVITPATVALADVTVWLESSEVTRKERALIRDGDLYRPHWDRWAAQEERHLVRDGPETLADLVIEIP